MGEEAEGGGTAPVVGDREEPAENILGHLECLGVGHEKEDESCVEGVLRLQGQIWSWGSGTGGGFGGRWRRHLARV